MNSPRQKISVFEHQTITYGKSYFGVKFKESHFNALAKLNELHDNKYFTLVHKGVKFSSYVGVIQIGDLILEVLPKIDRSEESPVLWKDVLIEMLRTTRKLKVNNIGNAFVAKQHIHLLDIYFEWFLNEVQALIHQGLIKKYYKQTSNVKALKGKLEFANHIQKNLVHKERFYTTHQIYGTNHLEHQILGLALKIIAQFSNGTYLYSKCKTVQLDFPEVDLVKPHPGLFSKLVYNRKNKAYKTALEIARIIILNFAPSVSSGNEKMLALLFDMNDLWEEYVLIKLKSLKIEGLKVIGQSSKRFWHNVSIRPDIIIQKNDEVFVIDTKWKHIQSNKPSTHDLRQMFVYNRYWGSYRALLLYPSNRTEKPSFMPFEEEQQECAVGKINIIENDSLKSNLGFDIINWLTK
ncbi:McrC family protein [Flagellimonas profundi]|uniref:Restriction endonuclease n=1 Tax=Flagellimonas profundi TaxID=2915620 RepID=A0ABS3FIV7_9FLAO|nr:restriction endonuclease [Allomuricauda profundi]MBO0343071.1 restriction endonuclease [Allomuricauda profundi]